MPTETKQAVQWAIKQSVNVDGMAIKVKDGDNINRHLLVDKVREYFNNHNIEYDNFSYEDLIPFLE